ncbi:hypothetical protein GCM10010124_11040 [Pilimelia terevasa]|uniref:Uncharacterized protein n=1 Tax=Pilimelia terevasa TaxID=53372 RepID=A0A8J3BMN1_9ACTN|nr:hypothetical protein [Pilimelia terevasa]GGK20203.1 hypothetical protein GCM10010124_11040 [Pilimelia terevasa]
MIITTEPDTGPRPPATRSRRELTWAAAAGGGALAAAAAGLWGFWNPGDYLYVERLLHHPWGFASFAAALTAAAVVLGVPGTGARWVVGGLTGLLALLLASVGLLLWLTFGGDSRYVDAPEHRPYRLEVAEVGSLDPLHLVYVESTGLAARRLGQLGCFDADSPMDALVSARWNGPAEVILETGDGREHPVPVDPGTGRPADRVSLGSACQD